MRAFDCLIVLGGARPSLEQLRDLAQAAQWVIAADKGAEYLLEAQVPIDYLVGDMDSLPPERLQDPALAHTEVKRYPTHKDDTDAMIAAELALALGAGSIVFAAALGTRLDHMLGNIQILYKLHRDGVRAQIVQGRARAFVGSGCFTIEGEVGDTVSLFPLGRAQIADTSGLEYPVMDADLPADRPLGVSNVLTEPQAAVTVENGYVLAVVPGED